LASRQIALVGTKPAVAYLPVMAQPVMTEIAESHTMSQCSPQHEEDLASIYSDNCAVCLTVFSKRRLTLRYQCGICAKSVCSACSPSSVQLDDYTGMQRVCTPCISNAAKVPAAQSRLVRLGEQLDVLGGRIGPNRVAAECSNLEEALDFSESTVAPLANLHDRLAAETAQAKKLQAALETEKRVRAQLEQELQTRKKTSFMFPTQAQVSLLVSEKQPDDEITRAPRSSLVSEKQPDDEIMHSSIGKQQQPRGMNCVNTCTQQ